MADEKKPAWGDEKIEAPKEFAKVTSLGAFEKAWPNAGKFSVGNVFMIIAAIFGVIGGVMAFVSQNMFAFLPFGSFFVIFFPIGLYLALAQGGGATAVATYDEGFAALVKSKVVLFPWDEVKTIFTKTDYRGGSRGGGGVNVENHKLVISKQSGESVLLLDTDLKDTVKLVTAIKEHVNAKLLPPLQKSYDAGNTLVFGSISVSNKIFESGAYRFEWTAIKNVVVTDGRIIVNPKDGEPLKIRVSLIPNVDLVLGLIGAKYTRVDLAYRW